MNPSTLWRCSTPQSPQRANFLLIALALMLATDSGLAQQEPAVQATKGCWEQIEAGQWLQARPACERELQANKNSATTVNLGHTYLLMGQREEAYRRYLESVKLIGSPQQLKEGPLADFDLFIRKGWRPDDSREARAWFEEAFASLRKALSLGQQLIPLIEASRFSEAEPKAQEVVGLMERFYGAESLQVGTMLALQATLYRSMGQFERALPLMERALAINEKAGGPEHPRTGTVLNTLALLHQDMGHYKQAAALLQRSLTISERAFGSEHTSVGARLNTLGSLYQQMGRYEEAVPLYRRALTIFERSEGTEHPITGASLNNLAALYRAMGRYDQALPLHQRALAISEKANGAEHSSIGTSLSNLALLYRDMGRYDQALSFAQRTLAITEKADGSEHPRTGASLNALAMVYLDLGRYELALPLLQRALAITQKAHGAEHPAIGAILSNLAALHFSTGRYDEALPLLQRALAISEKAEGPGHPSTGASLSSLASLYTYMGHNEQALPLYQRALAISELSQSPTHPDRGLYLSNLAELHRRMGRPAQAQQLWQGALPIALRGDLPEQAWRLQHLLSAALAESDPATAIFWGKQSVNTLQSMRAGLSVLNRETQQSFLRDKRHPYTQLSDLLITQGRIIEAQRVMVLLKEEEFFEFIRRDGSEDPRQSRLPLTGAELAAGERLDVVRKGLGTLMIEQQQLLELQRKGGSPQALTPAEQQRLAALEPEITAARVAFEAFVASLSQQLAAQGGERLAAVARIETHQGLLESLGEAGRGVAVVQYVPSPAQLNIIVSTTAGQQAVQMPLKEAELNKRVAAFRTAVQERQLDPRPLGRELARQLLDPIAPALREQGIHTLLLMLDGSLRYVPFAALAAEDGRYLVQHYQLAVYTEAAGASLAAAPRRSWQVAALGVSRGFPQQNFRELPAVPGELEAIVRPGVLPGSQYLNEAFTLRRFTASLGLPVLHIASHFRFVPGSDESFLLLGDGSGLTLRQLRTELPRLAGVELLTLSACETAVGGGLRADGREVEGLGVLAQKRGAQAVLASLWAVDDASTGQLMAQFYRLRQAKGLNKAQALRQAQLALLASPEVGQSAPNAPAEARGGSRADKPAQAAQPAFAQDPQRPYAHPFFWAPFILMGNWL